MKKNASVLNKTATVILLIFSVAFFLYGIYMVMYSVRYIQEYDSMAGTGRCRQICDLGMCFIFRVSR